MKNRPMAVVALALALLAATSGTHCRAGELPEGTRGFSGQVRGVVVEKGERDTFAFKVGRVFRTWEDSEAEKPESLVGQTVPVGARWVKGDGKKWHPVERHVAFIRRLERGAELTLEIKNVEREHFAILELSEEQQRLVREPERERVGPEANQARRVEELESEVRRLRAEIRELRELMERRR